MGVMGAAAAAAAARRPAGTLMNRENPPGRVRRRQMPGAGAGASPVAPGTNRRADRVVARGGGGNWTRRVRPSVGGTGWSTAGSPVRAGSLALVAGAVILRPDGWKCVWKSVWSVWSVCVERCVEWAMWRGVGSAYERNMEEEDTGGSSQVKGTKAQITAVRTAWIGCSGEEEYGMKMSIGAVGSFRG